MHWWVFTLTYSIILTHYTQSPSGWKLCRNWHPHAYPICSVLAGITTVPSVIAYIDCLAFISVLVEIAEPTFYSFNITYNILIMCCVCVYPYGCEQYLKNFHARQIPVLERFALIISVTVIWAYAHLLTASGAYKHRPDATQFSCRTDRANLISSAPWLVPKLAFNWFHNLCSLAHL